MGVRSNLRVFRTNRGLSVRTLGEMTDIHFTYIAAFERDRMNPTLDEVERLCRALRVTVEDIYPDPEVRRTVVG